MKTRTIGSLTVSLAGLGCNNFGRRCDAEQTGAVVNAALDAGITLFDTADIYGGTDSERFLGAALGARRDEAVIATKFGHKLGDDPAWLGGGSARWIQTAVEGSLRRLGTDRIDLYQMHRPDDAVGIDETLDALDRLVRDGKVREIGHSNFSGAQIDAADATARARGTARFVCAQNLWSVLRREIKQDILPACRRHGLAVLPYFPLAMGMLTGKVKRGQAPPAGTRLADVSAERAAELFSDRAFDVIEELERFASVRGRTLLELAMSWLASQDSVASVIAGATSVEQVRANAAAVDWELTRQELSEIDAIAKTR